MNAALAVALGGAAGSVARYWLANAVYDWLGRDFPYGTLTVNVLGGLFMGFLTELLVTRFAVAVEWRLLVLVGFLGGFTTFSTFSMDTWLLLHEGEFAKAGLNALSSVVLCVLTVWMGLHLASWGAEETWQDWLNLEAYGSRLLLLAGLAYMLGLLAAGLMARLAWSTEMQALSLLSVLALLVPCGTWYLLRSTDSGHISQLFLAFLYSAITACSGLWLGFWPERCFILR